VLPAPLASKERKASSARLAPPLKAIAQSSFSTRVAQTFMGTLTILFVIMAVGFFRVSSRQGANEPCGGPFNSVASRLFSRLPIRVMIGDAKR
jgi:hypothetical protein